MTTGEMYSMKESFGFGWWITLCLLYIEMTWRVLLRVAGKTQQLQSRFEDLIIIVKKRKKLKGAFNFCQPNVQHRVPERKKKGSRKYAPINPLTNDPLHAPSFELVNLL